MKVLLLSLLLACLPTTGYAKHKETPALGKDTYQCAEVTGELGIVTTCWDATVHPEPDYERNHRLVELTLLLLGGNMHPPIEVYYSSFKDFEERLEHILPDMAIAQQNDALLVFAHCREVFRGEQPVVIIEAYQQLDDRTFIHEFLHAALDAKAPHPNLFDNHIVLEEVVRRILTSSSYKEMVRSND